MPGTTSERTMMALAPDTLDLFRAVSTATLTTQLFKRGLRNVFIQGSSRLTTAAPDYWAAPERGAFAIL